MLRVNNYNYSSWGNYDNIADIRQLLKSTEWFDAFTEIYTATELADMTKFINDNRNADMFPYPDLLFEALRKTPISRIKVVIIGQDPYFNKHNDVPEAMGLSFSVPVGMQIPSSLNNIYRNGIIYKHIAEYPTHGNLESWAYQGVLLLNSSLTVLDGRKNVHQKFWAKYTDKIVKYISDKCDHVVFVLWGSYALDRASAIDTSKHRIVGSSHPSGLSCNTPVRSYGAFMKVDQFGEINKHIESMNMQPIVWQLVNYIC